MTDHHAGRTSGSRRSGTVLPTARILLPGLLLGFVAACSTASGTDRIPTVAPSSPVAASTPIASATPIASTTPTPSPSGLPSPSETGSPDEASSAARVAHCQNPLGWGYVVSGNDLFIVCDGPSDAPGAIPGVAGPYVVRLDLATDKVTATYHTQTAMTYIEDLAVVNGSLWFDGVFGGSACVPGGCDGWHRTERFDVATGKNTLDVPDVELVGSALGYVWVRDTGFGKATQIGRLRKLDPATGREKGSIAFQMDRASFACGALWGMSTTDIDTATESTSVVRIDPASGAVSGRFTVPGRLEGPHDVGSECWASVTPGGSNPDFADYADHFVRLGDAAIEDTSPRIAAGIVRGGDPGSSDSDGVWEGRVEVQAGAFWLARDDLGSTATLQRIDPSTWQPSGPIWVWAHSGLPQGSPFALIDGSAWAFDDTGGLVRLDFPTGGA